MSETRYQWRLLRAGPILLDGGGMFGLVPRVVWSKLFSPDDQHRIKLAHNCLLLQSDEHKVLIETGTGDKLDAKMRQVFGIEDHYVHNAVEAAGVRCEDVDHVIVTHLHFDHAGGLTRRDGSNGVKLTFPNARIITQQREWEDALANRSVMTRTYYRDHLDPIRDKLQLVESAQPFKAGQTLDRDQLPSIPIEQRFTSVLPGIDVFLVPGHTWGQQAIKFTDTRGQTVVFTPDVMPTVHHVGAAYSLAYDVEPYMSMISRHWLLDEAARQDWLLVLDHEPGNPLVRVRSDGKGWYKLIEEKD